MGLFCSVNLASSLTDKEQVEGALVVAGDCQKVLFSQSNLTERGILIMDFPNGEIPFKVHVFHCSDCKGEIIKTEEMKPQWFDVQHLPYNLMWSEARLCVEVFIEDRSTHSGPFQLPVRPSTTLLELKERKAKTHDVKAECQRWILGRRLVKQDQFTLKDYDICPCNSSLFLYVLNDPNPPPKFKINQLQPDSVQPQPINPTQAM